MTEAEQSKETEHKRIKKRKFLVPIALIIAIFRLFQHGREL